MIEGQRQNFDIPDDVAYFDCATMSPSLKSVRDACGHGLESELRPWMIAPSSFLSNAEPCREIAASLIGTRADDIAFVPGATYGIAVAALNVPLKAGQTILIAEGQHTANAYSWRRAAERTGASVQVVPSPGSGDWTSAVLAQITPATGVAALPPYHSSDGRKFDLARIGSELRRVGAALVVDATHTLGARSLDVGDFRPDFMVAGAYKWLLGPYATGLLYVAPAHHQGTPLEEPGLNRRGAYDFENNTAFHDDYLDGARRFDVAGRGNFGLIAGLDAALRHIAELGIPNIQAHIESLTSRIVAELGVLDLPWVTAPSARGHYASVEFAASDAARLSRALGVSNVFASVRNKWLRVTPHIYNTLSDVDLLVVAMRKAFR